MKAEIYQLKNEIFLGVQKQAGAQKKNPNPDRNHKHKWKSKPIMKNRYTIQINTQINITISQQVNVEWKEL